MTWEQASTYCKWAGGGLPTEAQWEYVARGNGDDRREYPWGSEEPSNQLCWTDPEDKASYRGTCVVGSYPSGASPFGVLDMAGNVSEWVADWYAPYAAAGKPIFKDPRGPDKPLDKDPEPRRVKRGGGWADKAAPRVRASFRGVQWIGVQWVHEEQIGFRCARRR